MKRRVVVTGAGALSPVGHSTSETWDALKAGRSGLGPIAQFDASTFPTRIAGEVHGFDFPARWKETGIDYPIPTPISRTSQLALLAAVEAWRSSGLAPGAYDPVRAAVYLGAGKGEGLGEIALLGSIYRRFAADDGTLDLAALARLLLERCDRRRDIESEPGRSAIHIASMLGLCGPVSTCLTACAAGAQAVGEGMRLIQSGDADVVLAGGAHSMVTPQGIIGFCLLGALSTDNDTPTKASRPFDKTRNGFVLAEGAAMLVLEDEGHARRRGAAILGEIAGYGCTADAYRVTDPHPEGVGEARAMARALADAGVSPGEVGYVNAHGTSTKDNDEVETAALKRVLGDHAMRVPVSSTKSMTGHLIAAAGALEAIVCLLAMRDGIVPPTINLEERDEQCDLDYCPGEARAVSARVALSNSFGFGGQNTALVLRRV